MDKIERKALKLSKKKIDEYVEESIKAIRYRLRCIEKSETIEELMTEKKKLLVQIVKMLPLDVEMCPYCHLVDLKLGSQINDLTQKQICDFCDYGKRHGMCIDYSSDYGQIDKAVKQLLACINNYWGVKDLKNKEKSSKEMCPLFEPSTGQSKGTCTRTGRDCAMSSTNFSGWKDCFNYINNKWAWKWYLPLRRKQ